MKCYKCGAELGEGMTFCPSCGAAQNMQQPNGQPNGQEQQWQPQQPNGQYQYQGWAQNNVQYSAAPKKKSRTPLIIGLVAAVVLIIGLAVTCIILVTKSSSDDSENSNKGNSVNSNISSGSNTGNSSSGNSSNPEKLNAEGIVAKFLDELLDGDYAEARDYVLSGDIDYLEFGEVDLSRAALKELTYTGLEFIDYEIDGTEDLSNDFLDIVNEYINCSSKITSVCRVGVYFIDDDYDYDDAAVYLVKTNRVWYIIGIEF